MKHSIQLTIVIVVLGAAFAFHQQHRLSSLRDEQGRLARQAGQLGLDTAAYHAPAGSAQARRQREDRSSQAARLARDIAAFTEELRGTERFGLEPDAASSRRAMELVASLARLDAAGLRSVISQLREGTSGAGDSSRDRFIAFALLTIADDRPQDVLEICNDGADWLGKILPGGQLVVSSLGNWARQDPAAALAWFEQNAAKHPELAADEAIDSILGGAARSDPHAAFRLLGKLGAREPQEALTAIMATAEESPEQRGTLLAALRGHLATVHDAGQRAELRDKALELMARGIEARDFSETTGWLASQRFSPEEVAGFAGGLTYFTTGADSGRWIDWLAGQLPAGQLADPVREIVGEWTQQDYLAAGNWLSAAADGPAKTAAVEAYAIAVAEYEPQVAEQWALTLPPGTQREATLRAIHENWPFDDPTGAEAFARKYGLAE